MKTKQKTKQTTLPLDIYYCQYYGKPMTKEVTVCSMECAAKNLPF